MTIGSGAESRIDKLLRKKRRENFGECPVCPPGRGCNRNGRWKKRRHGKPKGKK